MFNILYVLYIFYSNPSKNLLDSEYNICVPQILPLARNLHSELSMFVVKVSQSFSKS